MKLYKDLKPLKIEVEIFLGGKRSGWFNSVTETKEQQQS
jgi:hypothetical protein